LTLGISRADLAKPICSIAEPVALPGFAYPTERRRLIEPRPNIIHPIAIAQQPTVIQ